MGSVSIHQFVTIYTWFGLGALFFLMALIARFYERLSEQRTHYRLFALPMVTFAVATVIFTRQDVITGVIAGDLFLFVGGLALGGLCLHIYRLMTSGR